MTAPSTRSTGPRLQPWEQRDNESAVAFEAFAAYRNMGHERSTAKVALSLGKSKTLMDRWSSAHSWVLRAGAWDREQDKLWHAEIARQRKAVVQRNLDVADVMKNVAAGGLRSLADHPDKMKAGDIARLFEVAARLEAVALAAVPTVVGGAGSGPAGAEASRSHVAHLSDEDRRARMAQLQRELASRLDDTRDPDDEDEEAS